MRDQDLIICQVPPTQLFLAQSGSPVILPDLDSWRPGYQPRAGGDVQGLGATDTATPQLYRAVLEEGDLLTLCSTNLARLLADESDATLAPLLGSDPHRAAEFLQELAERHGLDPAFGVAIAAPSFDRGSLARAIGQNAADANAGSFAAADEDEDEHATGSHERWLERSLREMRDWSHIIPWSRRDGGRVVPLRPTRREDDLVEETATADATHDYATYDDHEADVSSSPTNRHYQAAIDDDFDEDDLSTRSATVATAAQASHPAYGYDIDDEPVDPEERVAEAVATPGYPARQRQRTTSRATRGRGGIGQGLGSLVAFIVVLVGSALERILPNSGRRRSEHFLDRSRNRVWPLGTMERHAPGGIRIRRSVPLIALGVVLVLAAVLTVSVRNRQIRAEQQRFDTAVAEISRLRTAATAAPDKLAAYSQLLLLPDKLGSIVNADKPGRPEQIATERAALAR